MWRFFLYLLLALPMGGFCESPRQSREMQKILVDGRYIIAVDTDPAWTWLVNEGNNAPIFVAESPDFYYPPATVNVSFFPQLNLSASERVIQQAAYNAIATAAKNLGAGQSVNDKDLKAFTFNNLSGYSHAFQVDYQGQAKDVEMYVGRNPSGQLMSLMFFTAEGKIDHLDHLIDRIGNSVQFVP